MNGEPPRSVAEIVAQLKRDAIGLSVEERRKLVHAITHSDLINPDSVLGFTQEEWRDFIARENDGRVHRNADRNAQIVRERLEGSKIPAIAERHRLTERQVMQILSADRKRIAEEWQAMHEE